MRVIENISVVVAKRMLDVIKISRDDPVHIVRLIDDSTKETGSVLASDIEAVSEKVANIK